jgi:hypothetical protein
MVEMEFAADQLDFAMVAAKMARCRLFRDSKSTVGIDVLHK